MSQIDDRERERRFLTLMRVLRVLRPAEYERVVSLLLRGVNKL